MGYGVAPSGYLGGGYWWNHPATTPIFDMKQKSPYARVLAASCSRFFLFTNRIYGFSEERASVIMTKRYKPVIPYFQKILWIIDKR
jgi:hypothetical protein